MRSVALALALSACAPEPAPVVPEPPPVEPSAEVVESADAGAPEVSAPEVVANADAAPSTAVRPADYPEDVPFVSGARVSSRSADGPIVRLEIAKDGRDTARVYADLLSAAREQGFRVVTEHATEQTLAFERGGKKSWLRLFHGYSRAAYASFHRAGAAQKKLAGACVPIPEKELEYTVDASGIDQQGESFGGSRRWLIRTAHLADVDDDGEPDAFVPVTGGKCPWDVRYAVYALRGTCGHKLGEVGPGQLGERTHEEPVGPSGFRALLLDSDSASYGARGVPESVRRTVEFRFDGGTYRKVKDETQRGKCHHCAVTRCSRTKP
ncbi:MAG: hypothetical protein IPM35_15580 [Myxococcales bacterium]|nr:hypothetical protein [Myxococcales bacterium]